MKTYLRSFAVLGLLAVGVLLFKWMYEHAEFFNLSLVGQKRYAVEDDAWKQRIVLLVAAILTLIPFTRKWIARLFDFLRWPSATTRRWTAIAIAVLGGPLIYGLGAVRGRLGQPIWHDENMYRMQTTFLAHGKFCMPGLAHPDFFDSPYIFVHGVYAPVYFPGTALLNVPAAWMHLPYWFTPLVIAVTSLVLLYLIVAELIDGLAGLLAVVLMISLTTFRWFALVEMSHASGMMWGLTAFWAWLSWRKKPGARWVILAGIAGGFYAITRPLDAICLLAPLALAWARDLRGLGWGLLVRTILLAAAAAAPLLAVQLAFDRALTGHALEVPLDRYNRTYFHARSMGLQTFDPSFRPPTPVPSIQTLYKEYDRPRIEQFTTAAQAARQWITFRVPLTFGAALPSLFLVILLPVAVVGLSDTRRRVFWSMSWCFLIGGGFFYIFVAQYTIAAAPAMIFAVVLGVSVIQRTWPAFNIATVFVPLSVLLLGTLYIRLNQQDFFEPIPSDPTRLGFVSKWNYHWIPEHVQKPALVFFHFDPSERAWEEPVYNWDVLNPDDAPIIRAHDLGREKNRELIEYYARTQPDRHVYWFDRLSRRLVDLGNVKQAASP